MRSQLNQILDENGVVILDGALATELERRGAVLHDSLWSARLLLENPTLIQQVHADYLTAGAHVITSASYQATFAGFAQRGISHEQAVELLRLSVQLALNARSEFLRGMRDEGKLAIDSSVTRNSQFAIRNSLVAASVGPYGAYLADGSEYRGDYGLTIEQLMDFHRERMAVLLESGADLLACETIPCWEEGMALVRLLNEFPAAQAWLSFSCKDGTHVCHGETFAECVALANDSPQVVAVGVNCTAPEHIESLVHIAAIATHKPILVYPNRGETWDGANKCWLPTSNGVSFNQVMQRAYNAGARLLGGCCRTTPEDIRGLAEKFGRGEYPLNQ